MWHLCILAYNAMIRNKRRKKQYEKNMDDVLEAQR